MKKSHISRSASPRLTTADELGARSHLRGTRARRKSRLDRRESRELISGVGKKMPSEKIIFVMGGGPEKRAINRTATAAAVHEARC